MDSSMTSNLFGKFRPIADNQNAQENYSPPVNYKSSQHNSQDLATRFLFECGKLSVASKKQYNLKHLVS